jgi:hypothetical protein
MEDTRVHGATKGRPPIGKKQIHNIIRDLLPDSIKSITDRKMFRKEVKFYLKYTSGELERCVISYK